MNNLSKFRKTQSNIESRMRSREFHVKEAVADWVSRQEWKENDYIYFFIAGMIFWSIYVLMIMYITYRGSDFGDYWLVPCGLGLIAFFFAAWSYEKAFM